MTVWLAVSVKSSMVGRLAISISSLDMCGLWLVALSGSWHTWQLLRMDGRSFSMLILCWISKSSIAHCRLLASHPSSAPSVPATARMFHGTFCQFLKDQPQMYRAGLEA